jgi:hypothetical protein
VSRHVDWVDGWEIHPRPDGGYGVYDAHGLIVGPFGTKNEALAAALQLPKHLPLEADTRSNRERQHTDGS